MKRTLAFLLAGLVLGILESSAQPSQHAPHMGYLYPAGGQQGTSFRILVGGQYLRSVKNVFVVGEGITGQVIRHYRPLRNLDAAQRGELGRQMKEAWQQRLMDLPEEERTRMARPPFPGLNAKGKPSAEPSALPDHPLFNDIQDKSLRELAHLAQELKDFRKQQRNAQLSELLEIEIAIDADAEPGDRELRLGGPAGLSNPICFQVNVLPEVREQEPNNPKVEIQLPPPEPLRLPILINGQILPGDVDRIRFSGKQGQHLVADVSARRLIPFLADAVPGWFQAAVALYDDQGRELAYADDYRFNPDPVLFFTLPEDGVYELEIRDAIYRGRQDFVYRIALGELPFVARVFPLGGTMGAETLATISGINLPVHEFALDMHKEREGIYSARVNTDAMLGNEFRYAVDNLPESIEIEPNDASAQAQRVGLPHIVNGVIDAPGDVDLVAFEGRANEEVVIEVMARRLYSPLDSVIQLLDPQGEVLAWNDDDKDKLFEVLTHHADSRLCVQLPEDGVYQVRLSDAQQQGGPEFAYRLHLHPPRPDFALLATPSTLNQRSTQPLPITVHAVRKDGFRGTIEVYLENAPPGFSLEAAVIPEGQDSAQVLLRTPRRPMKMPIALQLAGRARIGDALIERRAIPAEDRMQAFLPMHLTPGQALMISVSGGGRQARKAPKKSNPAAL